jgi:putative transposase
MSERWKRSNTSVYNTSFHLIWCPKYRRKVLTDSIAKRLKEIVNAKALEHGWEIKSMEVMPDHVHIFVNAKPEHSPHYIVQQFKGVTSRLLRLEFPELKRRLPTLWTRSYYVESVGHISEATILRYIEDQKKH